MTRFKKFTPEKHEGKVIYANGIVDNIVMLAVSELPYVELYHSNSKVMKSNSIFVTFDKKGVNVEVGVVIHYTQRVSEVVFKVQEIIRHNVESMTEYKISSVDVVIKGVNFDEIKTETKSSNTDQTEEVLNEQNENNK